MGFYHQLVFVQLIWVFLCVGRVLVEDYGFWERFFDLLDSVVYDYFALINLGIYLLLHSKVRNLYICVKKD